MNTVQLSELAEIYLGVTHTPEYIFSGVPFLSVKDISGGEIIFDDCKYISEEEYFSLPKGAKPQEGDMLFCRVGTIGKPIIIPEGTPRFGSFVSLGFLRNKDSSRCDMKYLRHWMNSKAFSNQVLSNVKGASQVNLNTGWLSKFVVPLPSINEQAEAVCLLDKCEEIINKRNEELVILDKLIKARFVEMFGEPIDNPMNWPVKRLKELSSLITNGNTPKGGSENYIDQGIVFLRSQNVWRNRIDLSDVAYIDEDTHAKLKKSSVHHNDILITKTGRINTENSSLGRAALYTGEDNSANINGHVYLIRLKNGIDPRFVVTILTGEVYRKYIRKVCVGGIDKRQINLDQVEDFPIILPPLEQQIQFSEFVEQVDKSKLVVQKSLDETKVLFDSLMQEYFG